MTYNVCLHSPEERNKKTNVASLFAIIAFIKRAHTVPQPHRSRILSVAYDH